MPRKDDAKREYTEDQKRVVLAALAANHNDYAATARFTGCPAYIVRKIAHEWEQGAVMAQDAIRARPMPSEALLDIEAPPRFEPAPEVLAWVTANIIGDGPLYNPEHDHLMDAVIGILWTNVPNTRSGRRIVGQCEVPNVQGGKWLRARMEQQLTDWFDVVPDFVITLDAPFAAECNDASFCALVEHELLHAGQALDAFGGPAFTRDGAPKFAIRGHDAEEFVSVVRRYGVGAAAGGVAELVAAAALVPEIAQARIDAACGTCLRG